MFFKRSAAKTVDWDGRVREMRANGFEVEPRGEGGIVRRGRCVAQVREGAAGAPEIVHAGVLVGAETATLVDGGFQKFFETPSGKRRPAAAAELIELHAFEEDLIEALGLKSLYNQSLGTVCGRHAYDRLAGRN